MPAWATLVVDTAAPRLIWGGVGGAYAGSLLKIGYTLNEPGILAATLVLPDGRELAMTVTPQRLEVLLPPDTPDGQARVTVELADEVANTDSAHFDVYIGGAAPVVEARRPAPGPVGRPPATQRQTRLIRSPADPVLIDVGAGRIVQASVIRAAPVEVAVHVGPGTTAVGSSPRSRLRSEELAVRVLAGADRIHARRRERAAVDVGIGETAVTKRDGPDLEEALLLGLL